jgi:hypothetical protein
MVYFIFNLGIPDQTGRLEENQVFISYGDEKKYTILDDEFVLVTKNPCLHPGDIKKLKAVFLKNCKHLKNCIMFSTKGERPICNKISGSDYDGDMYCVITDQDLLENFKEYEGSMDYNIKIDDEEKKKNFFKENHDNQDRYEEYKKYMIKNESKIGLIDYVFDIYTDQSNVFDETVLDLIKFYVRALDCEKTGDDLSDFHTNKYKIEKIPNYRFKKSHKLPKYNSTNILGVLFDEIERNEKELKNEVIIKIDLNFTNPKEEIENNYNDFLGKYPQFKNNAEEIEKIFNKWRKEIHEEEENENKNDKYIKLNEEMNQKFEDYKISEEFSDSDDYYKKKSSFFYIYFYNQNKSSLINIPWDIDLCAQYLEKNFIFNNKNVKYLHIAPDILMKLLK